MVTWTFSLDVSRATFKRVPCNYNTSKRDNIDIYVEKKLNIFRNNIYYTLRCINVELFNKRQTYKTRISYNS